MHAPVAASHSPGEHSIGQPSQAGGFVFLPAQVRQLLALPEQEAHYGSQEGHISAPVSYVMGGHAQYAGTLLPLQAKH